MLKDRRKVKSKNDLSNFLLLLPVLKLKLTLNKGLLLLFIIYEEYIYIMPGLIFNSFETITKRSMDTVIHRKGSLQM